MPRERRVGIKAQPKEQSKLEPETEQTTAPAPVEVAKDDVKELKTKKGKKTPVESTEIEVVSDIDEDPSVGQAAQSTAAPTQSRQNHAPAPALTTATKESALNFDWENVRKLDNDKLKDVDTFTLLRMLMVRGKDSHNPTLHDDAQRILLKLNFESMPETENKHNTSFRGGFRGGFKPKFNRYSNEDDNTTGQDFDNRRPPFKSFGQNRDRNDRSNNNSAGAGRGRYTRPFTTTD